MQLSNFDYILPNELIARFPLTERSNSRLLCLNRTNGAITHHQFAALETFLTPGDLLVCNNSRVIPARLLGHKMSGGRVEVLVERILAENHVLAHVRASKAPKPGSELIFQDNIRFRMVRRQSDLFELVCLSERSVLDILETIGHVPIPPYFERPSHEIDKERYQTVYARDKGSVAAPTAGLHFDHHLFERLRAKGVDIDYVTLHVGAGTFASVKVQDITQHVMHAERVEVSAALCDKINKTKQQGGRVIAVGTTTLRSLESASQSGEIRPFQGETRLFVYPGYQFRCVDALITNFHLPCSTLLMLVAAFGGYEHVMNAYRDAILQKYRFFSYGDAMLLSA